MKVSFAAFLAFCFLTLAQISFGQTRPTPKTDLKTNIEDKLSFYSEKVIRNEKTKETQFVGKVAFKSNKLQFSGAEKLIFNETTKKMIIYGCDDFEIDGKFVIKHGEKLRNILEYTLGGNTVYLF